MYKGDEQTSDVDKLKERKKYYTDIPQNTEGFFLKYYDMRADFFGFKRV